MLGSITNSDWTTPVNGSLRDIRLFVAAYEERSFTAAARREHATQSGVSQHMRKLEDTLRAKLFARDRGRVVPTPAGDSYYRHCIELLNTYAKATTAVQRHGIGPCRQHRRRPDADHDALRAGAGAGALHRDASQRGGARGRGLQRHAHRAGAGGRAGVRHRAGILGRARPQEPAVPADARGAGVGRQVAAHAFGARAACRSRATEAGGAEQGQHAPPADRDLSRLQRRQGRAPAGARRHAGHARFRGPHRLGGDPARHHDGERRRARASSRSTPSPRRPSASTWC